MKRAYLAIALALVLLPLSAAADTTTEPCPQGAKATPSPGSEIHNQNQAGQTNQLATREVPTGGNQQSSAQADNNERRFDEQVRIEQKVARFTGLLVLVGFLQFVALIVQAVVFVVGLYITNNAANAAKQAANAAKSSATTAQKTLLTTQRPKLIVRNVVIRAPNPPAIQGGIELFHPRYEVNGQLYVVNVGGTVAITKECWCWGIAIKGELPMEPPYEGGTGYPLTRNLRPGEPMPITFRNLKEIGPEGPLIRQGSDGWGFYVIGWIEYADDLGLIRRTAFCRKWDADRRRLIAIDNPDYEHAE